MPDRSIISQLEDMHVDAFGWSLHCCGGVRELAEDILQCAYLKVLLQKAKHDASSSLKTWWFGVIRFTASEEMRRKRVRDSALTRLWQLWLPSPTGAVDPRPHASLQFELSEEAQHLRSLLAQLPGRQSEVLHLVFYQDLTLADAAIVMGISLGSVRQHYKRGKQRLRTLLEESACHE